MSSEVEFEILLISHYTFVVWLGITSKKTLRSRAVWTLVPPRGCTISARCWTRLSVVRCLRSLVLGLLG